jgi:hypothetical protein
VTTFDDFDPRDFIDEERLTAQLIRPFKVNVDTDGVDVSLLLRSSGKDGAPALTEVRLEKRQAMILARSILDVVEAYEREL